MKAEGQTRGHVSTPPAEMPSKVAVSGYGKIAVIPKEDAELTRVGFGTPMGELLRRFWQPVCLAEELKDLPKAVRILGEELTVFRNGRGQVGVLDAHCIHRGASLEYGRIEEEGIRCCYHGLLFGTDGRCLQQPTEPPSSTYKNRLAQPAYPAVEYGGLVFAYMGPPDKQPQFPIYESLEEEGTALIAYRNYSRGIVADCNWLQIHENAMDPVHTAFLHSTVKTHFTDAFAVIPTLKFEEIEMGIKYIRTADLQNGLKFIRVNEIFMPNVRSVSEILPSNEPHFERAKIIGWWVPVDDTHTIGFHIEALPVVNGKPVPSSLANAPVGRTSGTSAPRKSYEDTQRDPDDCEAQVSQRPIAIHALEHRGTTDLGLVMFRRMLRKALGDIAAGLPPKGLIQDPARRRIHVEAGNTIAKA